MAISRKLVVVFITFYFAIIIYLLFFIFVPEFQQAIMQSRADIARFTEGTNYIFALLFAVLICLIGSASIGFPIPFPFILFSFSNSIFIRYQVQGLAIEQILMLGSFWAELLGIAIAGGFGCALGELTSYFVGKGAKLIAEKTDKDSKTLENVKGFGRLVLENPNRMYLYVFIAAALPIPDDPLWIAMGMSDEKISFPKCLLYGWLGKNFTTLFYVLLPILIIIGVSASGMEVNDVSGVITEMIMLIATLTIMFFILIFDWNKFLENREKKMASKELIVKQ